MSGGGGGVDGGGDGGWGGGVGGGDGGGMGGGGEGAAYTCTALDALMLATGNAKLSVSCASDCEVSKSAAAWAATSSSKRTRAVRTVAWLEGLVLLWRLRRAASESAEAAPLMVSTTLAAAICSSVAKRSTKSNRPAGEMRAW